MYALSILQHISRRLVFCPQLPPLSHHHSSKLGDLFRPSFTDRIPCSFEGVVGHDGTPCLKVSHDASDAVAPGKI
jgi:hypothetical protein